MAASPRHRDVVNHVLFEVATEVANRGSYRELKLLPLLERCELILLSLLSGRYLLRLEVKGSSHHL